jgi:hypothetical protein
MRGPQARRQSCAAKEPRQKGRDGGKKALGDLPCFYVTDCAGKCYARRAFAGQKVNRTFC